MVKMSWFTPTKTLLRQCNWLSVRQLAHYHTVLSTHKIVITEQPKYLFDKMCQSAIYTMRTKVKFGENFTGETAQTGSSFCYRGATSYNMLLQEISHISGIQRYKKKVKKWIMANIDIE